MLLKVEKKNPGHCIKYKAAHHSQDISFELKWQVISSKAICQQGLVAEVPEWDC